MRISLSPCQWSSPSQISNSQHWDHIRYIRTFAVVCPLLALRVSPSPPTIDFILHPSSSYRTIFYITLIRNKNYIWTFAVSRPLLSIDFRSSSLVVILDYILYHICNEPKMSSYIINTTHGHTQTHMTQCTTCARIFALLRHLSSTLVSVFHTLIHS